MFCTKNGELNLCVTVPERIYRPRPRAHHGHTKRETKTKQGDQKGGQTVQAEYYGGLATADSPKGTVLAKMLAPQANDLCNCRRGPCSF